MMMLQNTEYRTKYCIALYHPLFGQIGRFHHFCSPPKNLVYLSTIITMSEGYCCGIVLCGVNVGIPWNLIDIKSKNIILRALCCLLNIFLTPLLLIGNTFRYIFPCVPILVGKSWNNFAHAFRLYIFPCVSILVGKSWNNFVRVTCGSWSLYVDHEFPPTNESLGKSTSGIEWIRIQDLQKEQKSRLSLFGKMDPKSICQGALGDCWLLAAFATLCERPELIRSCFITSTFNPQGKYKIRLFDKRGKPVRMTIDDLIPCKNGTPVYAKLATSEIWPLLLEKAFAKINGSYHGIEGGDPMVAMKMVSGYEGESFHSPFDATVFPTLQKYFDAGCLISAGSKGKDNTLTQGRDALKETIVPGHAYSILNIKTPTLTTASVKLLKLRNPWCVDLFLTLQ